MSEEKGNSSKVAVIDNHYTKEQIKQFQQAQKKVVFRRRRLTLILSVAAVLFLIVGFNLFKGKQKLAKVTAEREKVAQQQEELSKRESLLEREVLLLKDEDYVQKLARAKYFVSKDGELIYNIPQKNVNQRIEEILEKEKSTKETKESNQESHSIQNNNEE